MAAIGGIDRGGKQRRWHMLRAILCIVFILLLASGIPGCRGCRKDTTKTPEEEEKELAKKKEKPKDPFQAKRLIAQPTSGKLAGTWCKVGHWTGVSLEGAKANDYDFVGKMELAVYDGKQQPLPLPATPFELTSARQAALPKGQAKVLDSVFYVPPNTREAFISCRLNASRGGGTVLELGLPLQRMPSYQYHFIVLARVPEQYNFLSNLYSVRPFNANDIDNRLEPYYRITQISNDRHVPLPAYLLLWTSIAYVLWDDAAPTALDPDMQRAFLDWLNWGGQVIISGPDTLDTLRGSFLEPYLPAAASGGCKIGADELAEINAFSGKNIRKLAPVTPWSGIQFKKHPQAEFLPHCGNLLVERRVGRGRIVVSAFRLSDREFTNWPGVDEFFNAFLLRRPPRRFELSREAELKVLWADGHERLDAARISNLRFFARDAGLKREDYGADVPKEIELPRPAAGYRGWNQPDAVSSDPGPPPPGPGVAAWNDFSPVAAAARETLLNAAQVEIPNRSFVFLFLLVYLIVLVPFNWSIFYTFDRVEWAWIAAPIVALLSTGLVIKLAQLDIGFVRARTEIAVLEIQGDYSRGHLTRYNALYTSLSTPYDFAFDDGGAAVLPFPTVSDAKFFAMALGQQRRSLRYIRADQANLEGLPVPSNSTALMLSEEMFDLGGKLVLMQNAGDGLQIVNQTRLTLQGAGLIKKLGSGNLQVAWLGALQPGAIRAVSWINRSSTDAGGRLWPDERNQSALTMKKDPGELKDELNLRNLLDIAEKLENMRPGEIKLLAWMDVALPGLKITPAAPQSRHAALVLARLDYGKDEPPSPDANTAKIVESKY